MLKVATRIGLVSLLLVGHGLAREPVVTGLSAEDERIIAALPVVPQGLNQAHALEIKRSKVILATYTFKVQTPALTASEWVLIAARPTDLPSQKIGVVAGMPKGELTTDQGPLQQPLLRARIPVKDPQAASEMTWVVKTRAELYSRRLVARQSLARPPKPARLTAREHQLFLRRSREFDYDQQACQDWIASKGLKRQQAEGEVVFARRVFQFIARNFGYEYLGRQDRTASHVAAVGKSDCGGLAVLFVTVLRSQGVPARTLAGRWALSAKPGERVGAIEYFQEHVKAEFYANGVGWVPADLSSAVLHDKSPQKLDFFAADRGDFLTLHFDSDLAVDTLHFGVRTLNLLQRATYWASGTGTFKDAVMRENWQVEILPDRTFR